jgi:hypothetical protein
MACIIDCMYVCVSLLAWIDQVKMCQVFFQHLIVQFVHLLKLSSVLSGLFSVSRFFTRLAMMYREKSCTNVGQVLDMAPNACSFSEINYRIK